MGLGRIARRVTRWDWEGLPGESLDGIRKDCQESH